jgi:hypothetical protein
MIFRPPIAKPIMARLFSTASVKARPETTIVRSRFSSQQRT